MKVNIKVLGMSLFSGPRYLDLDTGEPCSVELIEDGIIPMPKRFVSLPDYSNAPLYQRYMDRVFTELPFEDTQGLLCYPRYDFSPALKQIRELEYIHEAYHFSAILETEILHNRTKETPDFPVSFPTYHEYSRAVQQQMAIAWCETHGIEWY